MRASFPLASPNSQVQFFILRYECKVFFIDIVIVDLADVFTWSVFFTSRWFGAEILQVGIIQVKSRMVVNINGSKASNFQAPFGLIGATGPIPANSWCFLAGFADITRIKGYGISTASVS